MKRIRKCRALWIGVQWIVLQEIQREVKPAVKPCPVDNEPVDGRRDTDKVIGQQGHRNIARLQEPALRCRYWPHIDISTWVLSWLKLHRVTGRVIRVPM